MWAVSGDQIFHRDAQGWSRFADESWRNQLRLPLPFLQQQVDLVRVRAGSPNHVWVAATSHILRWDGSAWTVYNFDDPTYPDTGGSAGYNYNDFWIDGPNDVSIAGGIDGVGSTMEPGIASTTSTAPASRGWRRRVQRFAALARWTGIVVGGQ